MKSKIVGSLIALVLLTAPVWGERDREHAGGGWHANGNRAAAWHGRNDNRGRDANWGRGYSGWGWQNANQPPGWSHGRKTGWGDCNVPPGQAKKYGCGVWNDGWWGNGRDHDGRWGNGRQGWRSGDNDDDDRAPVWQSNRWRRPPMTRERTQPTPPSGSYTGYSPANNSPAAAPSPQPIWRHR